MGEMVSQAARELDLWKMSEKKKFAQQQQRAESEHISLLGREFVERERVRVKIYNERLQQLELRDRQLTDRETELLARETELETARKAMEAEEKRASQSKTDVLQRVRRDLKARETECTQKDIEIKSLTGRIKTLEQEVRAVKAESDRRKESVTILSADLNKLKNKNTKLERDIELAQKNAEFTLRQKEQLTEENNRLITQQQNQLSKLSENLSALAGARTNLLSNGARQNSEDDTGVDITDNDRRRVVSNAATAVNLANCRRPSHISSESPRSRPGSPAEQRSDTLQIGRRNQETQVNEMEKLIQKIEQEKELLLRAGYHPTHQTILDFEKRINELMENAALDNQ